MASPDNKRMPEIVDAPATQPIFRILKAAWKHKSLLLLGLVLGGLGGTLYYYQKQPVYQSSTQLDVIKKRPETGLAMGMDGRQTIVDDYATTHVNRLRSPLIIGRAVDEHSLGELPSLAGKGDPVGLIIAGLTVSSPNSSVNTSSLIVNLSYRSTSPDDCRVILNAIIASYKRYLDEIYQTSNQETVKLIKSATKTLREDLVKFNEAEQKLRVEAPDFNRTKDGNLAQQDILTSIDGKRSQLVLRRSELETRKSTIEDALAQKKDLASLADLLVLRDSPAAASNELRTRLKGRMADLQVDKRRLSDKVGSAHPDMVDLEKQMKAIQELLDQLAKEESSLGNPQQRTGITKQQVDEYLNSLQTNLEFIDKELKNLDALYQEKLKEYRKLSAYVERYEEIRRSRVATQQLLDNLSKPLQQIDLVSEYGGYKVEILAPAPVGSKVEPRVSTVMPLACFAGLLLGSLMTWLAEVSDRSFRSPQEIRQRLGLPILGHVPHFEPASAGEVHHADWALSLCALHLPKSGAAEAFRGVRTALYYSTRGEGHQIIQVTSPTMGDGKSTLSCNLAISISQAGKKVLLIDADFRRPRVHRLFNLSPTQGFAALLSGTAQLEAVIQPTGLPNLDVLPCGPRPSNPADLLTSAQFAQAMETLRTRYDFIIVDTPPLLAVSDPSIVAPWVDGVLLAMRLGRKGRPAAERSVEMLNAVGATILGVIVNGYGKKGHEEYGYDYAYGYSYQYTSNYESDPEADSAPPLVNGHHRENHDGLVGATGNGELGVPSPPAHAHRNGARRATKQKRATPLGWLKFW